MVKITYGNYMLLSYIAITPSFQQVIIHGCVISLLHLINRIFLWHQLGTGHVDSLFV